MSDCSINNGTQQAMQPRNLLGNFQDLKKPESTPYTKPGQDSPAYLYFFKEFLNKDINDRETRKTSPFKYDVTAFFASQSDASMSTEQQEKLASNTSLLTNVDVKTAQPEILVKPELTWEEHKQQTLNNIKLEVVNLLQVYLDSQIKDDFTHELLFCCNLRKILPLKTSMFFHDAQAIILPELNPFFQSAEEKLIKLKSTTKILINIHDVLLILNGWMALLIPSDETKKIMIEEYKLTTDKSTTQKLSFIYSCLSFINKNKAWQYSDCLKTSCHAIGFIALIYKKSNFQIKNLIGKMITPYIDKINTQLNCDSLTKEDENKTKTANSMITILHNIIILINIDEKKYKLKLEGIIDLIISNLENLEMTVEQLTKLKSELKKLDNLQYLGQTLENRDNPFKRLKKLY